MPFRPSSLVPCLALIVALPSATIAQTTVDTRIGPLRFTHGFQTGYPTEETIVKLYDEMDFQRAVQAYLWALPLVSMAKWRLVHAEDLGAENGQIVYIESYADRIGGLTYNATTPYVLPFLDLADGPWVAELPGPDGSVRGAAHDMWQIGITSLTEPGKYIFVGPGQEVPEIEGFTSFASPTNGMLLGIRLMSEDAEERARLLNEVRIYPLSEIDDPQPRGFVRPEGKVWMAAQPVGLEYWELLNDTIQREPVFERDRFFMAMLKPLGIEKGAPFDPDWRQQRILMEAAIVGEAMAKANDFAKRVETSHYRDDVQWEFATTANPDQRDEHYDHLDERAAWFYEAVTNDPAMHGHRTGEGQVYLATYRDADGDWLDGGTDYILRVPADAPAEAFWSVTLYEVSTRTLIQNAFEIADRSSRMELANNDDGSVDIYMGPTEPEGAARQNWIPTEAGRAWFPYFRLYSPKQAFLDQTWVLPDIEKASDD
ncbi:MAG: DUF1254 domain-containing protein [Rhodobacteraceae bacterium]|jgi:hypothetical protein|nr:DUF1254 domain-containing protein [Paracoccaceae bacterium]